MVDAVVVVGEGVLGFCGCSGGGGFLNPSTSTTTPDDPRQFRDNPSCVMAPLVELGDI